MWANNGKSPPRHLRSRRGVDGQWCFLRFEVRLPFVRAKAVYRFFVGCQAHPLLRSSTRSMQSHTAIQVLTMDGPALTRDKVVWFEDGNIMVVAQDTGFRIYRGVLAAHSPIFGDMFTMSQPTDAKLLDGCPVVRISDSSHDFRAFLSVLFNFNKYATCHSHSNMSIYRYMNSDYSKHDHCIDFSDQSVGCHNTSRTQIPSQRPPKRRRQPTRKAFPYHL